MALPSPDLFFEEDQKEHAEHCAAYQRALQVVGRQLQYAAKNSRVRIDQCVMVTIPRYMQGVAKFSIDQCRNYVKRHLMQLGYEVKEYPPNRLHVSWDHYVPGFVRKVVEERSGVVLDHLGQVIPPESPPEPVAPEPKAPRQTASLAFLTYDKPVQAPLPYARDEIEQVEGLQRSRMLTRK